MWPCSWSQDRSPTSSLALPDAPNTIVEYASMTCPHCAQFQTEVFPQLKTKYIDTGKVRYMLREFPLDNLAAAAFMLARCAGDDRYYAMVDAMFSTQESWAMPGVDAKDKLLQIAQAGRHLQGTVRPVPRQQGAVRQDRRRPARSPMTSFRSNSTPTFFVNGKRLKGDHQLKDFDVATGRRLPTAPRPRRCRQGEDRRVNPASDRAISIQE